MSLTLVAVGLALLVSLAAPLVIKPLLFRLNVVDIPSERSSHSLPAIRGAGLATLLGFVVGYLAILAWGSTSDPWILVIVLCASVAAAGIGWAEDVSGLPIRHRVGYQLLTAFAATGAILAATGGPAWMLPLGGLFIAGFINVANFLDGVDGISGFHGIVFGVVYALIGWVSDQPWMIGAGLVLGAAYLAFLPWNLGRGSFFLGDSGSYLLGAAVSVIAVGAVSAGVSPVMVAAPVVIYLADAGFTLCWRIFSGQRWYESHRTHVYHQLEDLGLSHVGIAILVSSASCVTGLLGLAAANSGFWGALGCGAVACAVVVGYLALPAILRRYGSVRLARHDRGSSAHE